MQTKNLKANWDVTIDNVTMSFFDKTYIEVIEILEQSCISDKAVRISQKVVIANEMA